MAFCGLAGAVYLWNDIADVERDRLHPKKRLRPIAAGTLSIRAATLGAMSLVVLALSLAFSISVSLGLCAATYLVLNLAYSFAFKHLVIIDVLSISLGFVLRALAGVLAIEAPVTEWLLVLTLLLALFLALAGTAAFFVSSSLVNYHTCGSDRVPQMPSRATEYAHGGVQRVPHNIIMAHKNQAQRYRQAWQSAR